MNLMQSKLQQIFKEYTDLKNYIQEDNKNIEKLKKEVHDQALKFETLEEKASFYFDELGYKSLIHVDLMEKKKELYYVYQAYKDLIEIPSNIIEELIEYKVNTVFAIIDGEKTVLDKNLYDSYRKQSVEWSIETDKYNQIINNQGA